MPLAGNADEIVDGLRGRGALRGEPSRLRGAALQGFNSLVAGALFSGGAEVLLMSIDGP